MFIQTSSSTDRGRQQGIQLLLEQSTTTTTTTTNKGQEKKIKREQTSCKRVEETKPSEISLCLYMSLLLGSIFFSCFCYCCCCMQSSLSLSLSLTHARTRVLLLACSCYLALLVVVVVFYVFFHIYCFTKCSFCFYSKLFRPFALSLSLSRARVYNYTIAKATTTSIFRVAQLDVIQYVRFCCC